MEQKTERKCSIDGCKRPYRAKGYCNVHYKKWRRGEMDGVLARYRTCSEENCKKPTFKKGMCEQHYSAWSASKKPAAPVVEVKAEKQKPVEAAPVVEAPVVEVKVEEQKPVEVAPVAEVPAEEEKKEE